MGSRRRNLLILLFVLGLTAASVFAISQQRTVLGLDLRGGTELVYQANPTAKNPSIDPNDLDRAIDILRERTDELGVSEPEIARVGEDQIEVGLPDVSNAERAIEQVGTTAQLFFYDYEPNLVERDPQLAPDQQTFARLYDAVQFASERKPECFQDLCTTDGPRYYLFDESSLELEAGPADRRRTSTSTRRTASSQRAPRSSRSHRGPSCSRRPARATIPPPRSTRPPTRPSSTSS